MTPIEILEKSEAVDVKASSIGEHCLGCYTLNPFVTDIMRSNFCKTPDCPVNAYKTSLVSVYAESQVWLDCRLGRSRG